MSLRAGLALLGQIDEKFVEVVDVLEPLDSGAADRAFISRGYDATSHFETTVRCAACRATALLRLLLGNFLIL